MYGLLTHVGCGLNQPLRNRWMAHLCGVCLSLEHQAGQFARLTANGEAALLSALVSAQSDSSARDAKGACLLRRPVHLPVVDKGEQGVQFGAGMALLMASSKLRDHLHDGELHPRVLRLPGARLARQWGEVARQMLTPMGFDTLFIEGQIRNQSQLETHIGQDFYYYAKPTEQSTGMAFAHTAVLAGQPYNKPLLFEIGQLYGRILYLVDSFKDYVSDVKRGGFNALAAAYSDTDIRLSAAELYHQAQGQLNDLTGQLVLRRPQLAHAVLVHRLGQIGHHQLGLCQSKIADCKTTSHAALSIEPGPGHILPPAENEPGNQQPGVSQPCCDCCGRNDACMCCYWWPDCCINSPQCGHCPGGGDCDMCQNCDCGHCCQNCDCSHLCQGCDCSHCSNCDCGNCDCTGCCDCGSC